MKNVWEYKIFLTFKLKNKKKWQLRRNFFLRMFRESDPICPIITKGRIANNNLIQCESLLRCSKNEMQRSGLKVVSQKRKALFSAVQM